MAVAFLLVCKNKSDSCLIIFLLKMWELLMDLHWSAQCRSCHIAMPSFHELQQSQNGSNSERSPSLFLQFLLFQSQSPLLSEQPPNPIRYRHQQLQWMEIHG